MIRCDCPTPHREHEFTAAGGSWGLCALCSHTVGAHKAPKPNDEVAHRITRLLHTYDIADWSIRFDGAGLDIELHLTPPPAPGSTP